MPSASKRRRPSGRPAPARFRQNPGVARDGGQKAHEGPIKTAKELGIPMPNPTIKPLFVALFMTFMFASMLLIHKGQTTLAVTGVITFAILMTLSLYSWLLTPLEDEH